MTTLGELVREAERFSLPQTQRESYHSSTEGSGNSEILAKPKMGNVKSTVHQRENFTILDDSVLSEASLIGGSSLHQPPSYLSNQYNTPSQSTVPPPSGYLYQYPPLPVPPNYASGPGYEQQQYNTQYLNNIIPDFQMKTMPPPAQQFINQACLVPLFDSNNYPYVSTPYGNVYCPRQQSAAVAADTARMAVGNQYGQFYPYPQVPPNGLPAGGVPYLPNALEQDRTNLYMGQRPISFSTQNTLPESSEGFSQTQTKCPSVMAHVASCPMCQRYFKCDNRMYMIMIVMLIILFCVILFLALKTRD